MLATPALADFTITEGQPFSGKVVDVGGCVLSGTPSIYWGDGTPSSSGASDGATGITGSHTYAKARTANATVTYACANLSGSQQKTFQVTVKDAPLTSTGRNVAAVAGRPFTAVVARVDDANPFGDAGDFSAQVAWGDGSTSQASVTAAAGGGFDVTSTHTYAAVGSFTVSTTTTDDGGSSTTTSSTAKVTAPPPAVPRNLAAPVVSGESREGETLTTTTGNWSDAPSAFQYQWLRCTTATSCLVVAGATAASYTPVQADVGRTLRARVRARNGAGTSLPADSSPTVAVQPLVLRARFTMSPSPTCTGLTVTFDASISKTPEPPITHYRFTEAITPDFFPHYIPNGPYVIADGTSARITHVFGYDLDGHTQAPEVIAPGVYVANPRTITLTVTDGTGATDSYSQKLDFAQPLSTGSRAACPERHARLKAGRVPAKRVKFKATKNSLTATLPCPTFVDCSGTLKLIQFRPSFRAGAAGAGRRKRKPVVIATSPVFSVPGHRTARVRTKLTRAGRALVRRHRPLRATLRLTTIGATGRTTTQSRTVTLIARRKRR